MLTLPKDLSARLKGLATPAGDLSTRPNTALLMARGVPRPGRSHLTDSVVATPASGWTCRCAAINVIAIGYVICYWMRRRHQASKPQQPDGAAATPGGTKIDSCCSMDPPSGGARDDNKKHALEYQPSSKHTRSIWTRTVEPFWRWPVWLQLLLLPFLIFGLGTMIYMFWQASHIP
jgi:hypothetical protein